MAQLYGNKATFYSLSELLVYLILNFIVWLRGIVSSGCALWEINLLFFFLFGILDFCLKKSKARFAYFRTSLILFYDPWVYFCGVILAQFHMFISTKFVFIDYHLCSQCGVHKRCSDKCVHIPWFILLRVFWILK